MAIKRMNHAVLYVRDAEKTYEFYRDVFGFRVVMEMPGRSPPGPRLRPTTTSVSSRSVPRRARPRPGARPSACTTSRGRSRRSPICGRSRRSSRRRGRSPAPPTTARRRRSTGRTRRPRVRGLLDRPRKTCRPPRSRTDALGCGRSTSTPRSNGSAWRPSAASEGYAASRSPRFARTRRSIAPTIRYSTATPITAITATTARIDATSSELSRRCRDRSPRSPARSARPPSTPSTRSPTLAGRRACSRAAPPGTRRCAAGPNPSRRASGPPARRAAGPAGSLEGGERHRGERARDGHEDHGTLRDAEP